MRSHPLPIDIEKDRADYDKVSKILTETDDPSKKISRVQWILYQQLYNLGARIDRAIHEIAGLAPRVNRD